MKERIRHYLAGTCKIPLPPFDVERSKIRAHGELATNLAMVLAKQVGKKPREVADEIASKLRLHDDFFQEVVVAGPGFINFTLKSHIWQESLRELDRLGDSLGRGEEGRGKSIHVEFVSANPTGPLHIGNARGGPIGDAIAGLCEARGYKVTREFLVNDIGGQVLQLGKSIFFHYRDLLGKPASDEGLQYRGPYVREIAEQVVRETGQKFIKMDPEEAAVPLGRFGLDCILRGIEEDCERMGIHFDSWVRESDLLREKTSGILKKLKEIGVVRMNEEALWFAPKDDYLEDRECVLMKSDGNPTYFTNDIAYHVSKYERGYDSLINIWGANHHGHLPRMKAALSVLGYDAERLKTVFYQTVRLMRGGAAVTMSKRAGTIVTAREVIEEIGRDAFRFFIIMRAPESHMDLDVELAKKHTLDNPVYYVQYAHARITGIFRKGAEQGVVLSDDVDLGRLILPEEIDLIRMIHDFPEEVKRAAQSLEPHRIPFYLLEISRAFQSYYSKAKENPEYRVLGSDIDTTRSKMYLCKILKRVIANGLKILGVSAPEVMVSE